MYENKNFFYILFLCLIQISISQDQFILEKILANLNEEEDMYL